MEEHRVTYLITGLFRGPRKRKHNTTPNFRPSTHQHHERLTEPGNKRGINTFPFNLDANFQEYQDSTPHAPLIQNEHYEEAK